MITIYSATRDKKLSELEKFIGSEHNPKFFFSMTQINKLGINPQSKYNTPIGIYAYPLTKNYYDMLINNSLPFAGEQPHIQLFTLNVTTFNMRSYTHNQLYYTDSPIIKKMYGKGNDFILRCFKESREPTPISQFWNLTRLVSKTPTKWNALLRNLGYTNFYDPGQGTIHPSEPTQMVVLDPSVIIHLGSFSNHKSQEQLNRDGKIEKLFEDPKFHKYITPDIIKNLSVYMLGHVWSISNSNDNGYLDIIAMELIRKANPTDAVFLSLASATRSSPQVLTFLAKSPKDDIRERVARNYRTPKEILIALSKDLIGYVREAVAGNHLTPKEILIELSKDRQHYVCVAALHTLESFFPTAQNDLLTTACEIYEDILRIV
jgi:hypothetical protein